MKEPDWKSCTEEELWHWVAGHLQKAEIPTVLVGGAAAAVHSRGAYYSGDLDLLIDTFPLPKKAQLRKAMEGLGFTEAKGPTLFIQNADISMWNLSRGRCISERTSTCVRK